MPQRIKIRRIRVERFAETRLDLNLRTEIAVHRQDGGLQAVEPRQNNDKRRAADKYARHRDTRNNVYSVHFFAREQVPFGYVDGGVQLVN